MKDLFQLPNDIKELVRREQALEQRLNELEDAAVSISDVTSPELGRITILHSDIVRGILEKSRTFWIRISTILAVILVICICAILFNFYCW